MERADVELKKGLKNPLDATQVRKAVAALQAFIEKQHSAEKKKRELLASTAYISCIITRKTIPAKATLKPLTIDLPHSIFGGENDAELCLFVKDTDKDRIKQALAADPVPGLAKVMAVKKLRKNFKRFEDRRTLAGAYDMFLADDRILPYLKTPLGTKFFVKKKQPIAVRVSRTDVSSAIRAVLSRTAMHQSAGACTNVKIAHFGQSVDEIVANIVEGMNQAAAHIPKGWLGIQSVSIKTNDSIALPIYNALADMAKLPPVASKKAQLKRKLEDVEVTKVVADDAEKPAKKQKAETSTPSKKEKKEKKEKKAEKAETAEKKAEASTPSKSDKKEKKAQKAEKAEKKTEKSTPVKAATPEPKAKKHKATPEKTPEPAAKKQKTSSTPEPAAKKQKASSTPESTPAKSSKKDKTPTPTPTKKAKKSTPSKK